LDDDAVQVAFGNLLDCALICSELDIADVGLPFTLLEELFDTQTIPSCERLFNYLESRVERLTVGMDGGKGKALILLRLCNELLRRLSKAEDTIFCGRILIFLSKSFPISERSAVNLRGDFNVENVTIFDDIPDQPHDELEPMEVDANTNGVKTAGGGAKESDTKSEDTPRGNKSVSFMGRNQPLEQYMNADKLYTVFWSLQHDFADPTRLFVPENFQRFKNGLEATMLKFRQANVEVAKIAGVGGKQYIQGSTSKGDDKRTTGAAGAATGEKRKREDESPDEPRGEGFNPKYLTSRELFELEVRTLLSFLVSLRCL
jgi:THO complex subunit 1